jgi:hypothetical protein
MPIKAGERASEIQIKRFEKNHGINLPESYRAFMRQYGGGTPDPCWYIDAARNVELYVGFVFPLSAEQMAEQTFPFPPPAECGFVTVATNTGGDYFLLDLATEEIFYWRHEADDLPPSHEDLLWVGSNIGEVIDRLEYLPGEGPEEVDEIETIGASGDVEQLDDFVRRNGVSARGKSGMTVAETAARDGNLAVLRRCIELGGGTQGLLHFAASGDDLEIIEYLLDKGLGINDRNEQGKTPLDRVIFQNTYDFLVSLGAVHGRGSKPPHIK